MLLGWRSGGGETPPAVLPSFGAPRWPLSLQMYDTRGGAVLWTFSEPRGVVITEDEHGFGSLAGFQEMDARQAFMLYDLAPAKWLVLACGAAVVWEGRIEDRKVQTGGFGFTAFGGKRVLDDLLFTGLFSNTSYAGIKAVTGDELTGAAPHLWGMDNNNRLYFEINPANEYGDDTDLGALVFKAPHRGLTNLEYLLFDYDLDLPTDWEVRVQVMEEGFTSASVEWTFTSAGSPATGSQSLNVTSPGPLLVVDVRNATGAPVTGASGYAKLTSLRVLGLPAATLGAEDVIGTLLTTAGGLTAQLATSDAQIQVPGVDLPDVIYEDAPYSAILNDLTARGDSATPPRTWEWGVWEKQQVFFRPRGAAALHWYTDAETLNLESSLDGMQNQVYAVYQDPNGRTLRTEAELDALTYAKYGLRRMGKAEEDTTSATKAETRRDTYLQEHRELTPRAGLTLLGLYDATGARYPLWLARAGDTLTIRNFPPTLSSEADRIRTFRISHKSYNVDTDVLTPTPEYPLPTLEIQLANALK